MSLTSSARALLVAIPLSVAVPVASLPVAHAQPAKPVDKRKTAKQYVDAALAAQEAGDYDTAVQFYAKAYDLVPHPVLHFNMAQAHRLAGRLPEALELYKKYLSVEPGGREAKTAREWVATLEPQVAALREAEAAKQAEEARQAEAARAAEEARGAEEARKTEEAKQAAAGGGAVGTEVVPETPSRRDGGSGGGGKRIAGLSMIGVGALAIGGGVVFGLKARSLSDELSAPGATFDPKKVEDGEAADRNMMILAGVGAALVVGGGVLYLMGRKQPRERGIAIAPSWNGGPTLVVAGGF